MTSGRFLIYGATGTLIAEAAARRGLPAVLAARPSLSLKPKTRAARRLILEAPNTVRIDGV
jgi:short subunit dehydrogenase-like uncharacterized protein